MLETAIISELTADVTAILLSGYVRLTHIAARVIAYNTTSRMVIAPPLPITTAAAAGAASPALVCDAERGFGYVGNLG